MHLAIVQPDVAGAVQLDIMTICHGHLKHQLAGAGHTGGKDAVHPEYLARGANLIGLQFQIDGEII